MAREFTMGARIILNTSRYLNSMSDAIRSTDRMRDELIDLDSTLGRYRDSQGRLRESNGRFVRSAGTLTRSLEEQGGQMDSLRSKASGLTSVFAALGGAMAVKGAYNWLVEGNASMEQYQNTLSVVLKSEEKAVETLAWANKFAAETPFEIPQVVEATTVMSAYGITAQDNLGLIGDMASVMGKDLMQAVEAVADANTGELERLKEFGITKKMIEEQAALMGKQVFDKKGSMKDQEAFNDVLFTMMEERFKGGMEMQAKSFKGLLGNAQDYIGTMGRTLGKPIFDKMKVGLESVLETAGRLQEDGSIDRWVGNVQKGFGKLWGVVMFVKNDVIMPIVAAIKDFVNANKSDFAIIGTAFVNTFNRLKAAAMPVLSWLISSAFPALLGIVKDAGGYVVEMAAAFITNFEKFKPYIIGVTTAFVAYKAGLVAIKVWTTIVSKAQLAWNTVMAMNPIILIVLAIGLLIGVIITMAGGWDTVKEKLLVFWGVMVTTFKKIAAVVMPILQQLGTKLVELWTKALPMIKTAITTIKTAIVSWALSIWATIGPIFTTIWTGIVNMFNAIKTFWSVWGGAITAYFQVVWAFWSSIFVSNLTAIWSAVKGAFTVIYNIISGVFKTVAGTIQMAWAVISGIFSIALNLLSGDWKGAWDAMLGMLDGVWSGIQTFFGGLKDLFFDSGKAIITTLVDGIKSMAGAPVKAIGAVLGKVRDFLPFSDAKKGPLSNLTLNGGKIVTTMAEGIYSQQGALTSAMDGVLAPAGPSVAAGTANPAGRAVAPAASSGKAAVIIQKLVEKIEIYGADSKNAKELVNEILAELYERFVNADEILSAAGLGDLLND